VAELPFEVLEKMVRKVISPHLDQPEKVSAVDFRCIVKSAVIYYTSCRFADSKHLQARHVEVRGEDLVVTFPRSKNHQSHQGQCTVLKANGSDLCPVRLLKLYFNRFGLKFGAAAGDVTHLHCMFCKSGGRHYEDRKHAEVASLARENLHNLLRKVGQDPTRITDKRIKMLGVNGVTRTIEAGASKREVAHQGRWRTEDTPLRYKHNSGIQEIHCWEGPASVRRIVERRKLQISIEQGKKCSFNYRYRMRGAEKQGYSTA
jgi:hypothetical protein